MKIYKPIDWIIPILLNLTLFNGLIKAITGIRFFPLIIDFFLLLLIGAFLYTRSFYQSQQLGMIDILALLFMALAILGIFNSNVPSFLAGLEGFRKFSFMIIGIIIGRYLMSITTLKRFIRLLIISSVIISFYGIKQYLFPSALDYHLIDISTSSPVTYLMGGHIRAFSTLSGPFHLGLFLMAILLLLMSIWQQYTNKKILILIISLPLMVALIMTVTKSNWFGLIAGSGFLLIFNSKKPVRLIKNFFILSIIGIGIFILLLKFSTSNPIFQTINAGLQAFMNPLEAPTMLIRLESWKEHLIPLISQSPWIGYGTGSAGEGLEFFFASSSSKFINAHNIFLKVQFELGLVGLIIFIIFIMYTFVVMWRQNKIIQSRFLRVISNWSIALFISIMTAGMVGSILDAYPVNLLFWIILGSSTRLSHIEEKEVGKMHLSAHESVNGEML